MEKKRMKGWNTDVNAANGFCRAQYKGEATCNLYGEITRPILKLRPIPLLRTSMKRFENTERITVKPYSTEKIVLDAEKITTAYPRIKVCGGKGGKIRMRYAECYVKVDGFGKEYKAVRDAPTRYCARVCG